METGVTSDLEINIGEQKLKTKLQSGSGLDNYKTEKSGEITIAKPGELEVVLKSTKELGALVMNLRSVSLVPIVAE